MALLFCYPAQLLAESKPIYRLGIFPHFSVDHLEKVYTPLAQEIAAQADIIIQFDPERSFEKFREDLDAGYFHLVFVQPFDYIELADKQQYTALASHYNELTAIITTRPWADNSSLESLRGSKIALPPPSTAVAKLFEHHLYQKQLSPEKDFELIYTASHISCIQKVLLGFSSACVTVPEAAAFVRKRLFFELKTIDHTTSIAHTLFAAHPAVSKKDQQAITHAIVNLKNYEQGKTLLEEAGFVSFKLTRDSAYDKARRISRELKNFKRQ